jgi:cobalamin transport system substrate-binding protein
MGRRSTSLVWLFCSLGLVLGGCSSDEPSTGGDGITSTGPASAAFPVTISTGNGDVTIAERPEHIVSLSPTATEMLFAVGAGGQVEAVDDQSNYPNDAPMTDLSGFEPNVEAIASYEPDLVVYATETGDLGTSLEALGIATVVLPAAATLDDVYEQIEDLGLATGHEADAMDVTQELRAQVKTITASVPSATERVTFYHELDDTFYSVTSSTFIGQLYALLGLENIADEADDTGGGYPQLSAEYIIDADPDLIFLADTKCCGQSAETVADRPGWDRIAAVENGNVVSLDDDVASRWGPRVVEYLQLIANAVSEVEEADAA